MSLTEHSYSVKIMPEIKDTHQATVHVKFDGSIYKQYHGIMAKERFDNETRVLRYLEDKQCDFVPKLLKANPDTLEILTTNCGQIVSRISDDKLKALFDELETYGVRHEDAFARNVTYNARMGRFCIIDFEFATLLESGEGLTLDHPGFAKRHERTRI